MWLYSFAKGLLNPLYRVGFRMRVEGLQNVPREGGVILCANHASMHDPIMLGIAAPRPVSFMAKEELFRNPVLRFLVRGLGAFPVRRGHPDRAALKRAFDVLQTGGCFGVFPEGTRIRGGQLGKAEPGTAYMALKTGAAVIPVGISSSYRLFRPTVIRFGRPVDLSGYRAGKLSSEVLEAAGGAIMAAIDGEVDRTVPGAASPGPSST